MSRIIDLTLLIEDNMPAHKLFQRPVYTVHMSHESSKAHSLGVPGDAMTFQTNFIAMVDHVGTHVDAPRRQVGGRDAARSVHGQGRVLRSAAYSRSRRDYGRGYGDGDAIRIAPPLVIISDQVDWARWRRSDAF